MSFQLSIATAPIGELADVNPRGPARGEIDENEEVDFLPMADLHEPTFPK